MQVFISSHDDRAGACAPLTPGGGRSRQPPSTGSGEATKQRVSARVERSTLAGLQGVHIRPGTGSPPAHYRPVGAVVNGAGGG
jgi:hypothetical protein